jgi:hypothetical protein
MSYSDILASAAKQAQSVLASMADPDGDGEFNLGGETYTGTMSIFDKVLVATGNGYEEQRQIKIAATVAQFDSAPNPATRPAIVARGLTWRLTAVEPGAQFYVLTGVAA